MKSEGIHWNKWDSESFDRARTGRRLVLLYISASWCHWCHVMEADALAHPEVERQLSARYIPIRVDSDKRPDINSRYNMGGWPTVAILSPEGEVLAGETYLPVGSLLQMLHQVYDGYYGSGRSESVKPIVTGKKAGPASERDGEEVSVNPETVRIVGEQLKRSFDPHYGGFKGPVKFPPFHALELVFDQYRRTGDRKWLNMATLTLDGMRDGALHDTGDGGFFRYSGREDWEKPHYEKMLETQAGILVSYLSGFTATGDARYRATVREIIEYAMTFLLDEDGTGFYGSQTADPAYYEADESERVSLPPPGVDRTLYTQWNAQMAGSLLKAATVIGEAGYRETALGVLENLSVRCVTGRHQAIHYYCNDGADSGFGLLSDQSALIMGFLDAYELMGDPRYLELSGYLLDSAVDLYWDPGVGCFRDRIAAPGEPGLLSQSLFPLLENSQMARGLLRASTLMGEENYRTRSESILRFFSGRFESYRMHAAPYAVAVDRFLHEPAVVTIVASFGDSRRQEFIESAARLGVPGLILEHLDGEVDAHRIEARGFEFKNEPVAYACVGRTCLPPVHRPADLAAMEPLRRAEGARNE